MIVRKSSVFPASRETVFEKLQQLETLRYIAKPSFKEFQQVLPNLNRDQITVLLRGLRRENRAYCVGKTSAARWFAGPMLATDTY